MCDALRPYGFDSWMASTQRSKLVSCIFEHASLQAKRGRERPTQPVTKQIAGGIPGVTPSLSDRDIPPKLPQLRIGTSLRQTSVANTFKCEGTSTA